MSLVLNFNVCQSDDCTTLTFTETTGAYNVSTNPTGWGAPNPVVGDATSATLTITLGSGDVYTIDLLAEGFPTTDDTIEFTIPNADFGYVDGDPIDDQIITFNYSVIASGTTYSQTKKLALYCQARCCVMSMFSNLDLDCDCFDDASDRALKAYALFKGLVYSANSGNTTYFNNILEQVNKLCANSNCSNCN